MTLLVRLLVALVGNLLLVPINLIRWLRPRPWWIVVRLDGTVPERAPRRRWPLRRKRHPSVEGLAELGRRIAADPAVRGVVLEIEPLSCGWARLDSLRAQVAAWRAAGKRVIAHCSSPGNRELYLALAAHELLVDESGPIGLTGLAAEYGYYGEALRRIGVDPELDRIGDYKSFADTFTRDAMSPAQREAVDAILDTLSGRLEQELAEGRKIDRARARELTDGGPYLAEAARAAGLVDGVCYRDQLPEHLSSPRGRFAEWRSWLARRPRWIGLGLGRRLAVLTLEGVIAPGEGSQLVTRTVGAESATRALQALRRDGRVCAVVLHVDSRGGSASASDRIWREVLRLAQAKPTVAYLGDVAASGGYYVVAPCAAIVAQPSTLTGSIGVVAGKLALERLLERAGVGSAIVSRGQHAGMGSIRRRYDDGGRAKLREELEGVYAQFVGRVADGRKMDRARVDAIAQGRVWTGEAAKERGLVDQLGDLAGAVAEAERRAGRTLRVVDAHPRPRGGGLADLLRNGPGVLARLWSRERAWLDADVPEIR
jgi:protease-4